MSPWVEFLVRHSYPILFFWVLVEQLGLPLPGLPLLLAAGALAGAGQLNLAVAVTLPVLAYASAAIFCGSRSGGIAET
jgi:membrane protein DedA with SNARE-associated domain